MTDKLVTHADLPVLRRMRGEVASTGTAGPSALLDRLIAAAEADAPPLPEGWYELVNGARLSHAYVHSNGQVSRATGGVALASDHLGMVEEFRDRLTPLRPTVTEADVEKAAEVHHAHRLGHVGGHGAISMRAAFEAAGIEVSE